MHRKRIEKDVIARSEATWQSPGMQQQIGHPSDERAILQLLQYIYFGTSEIIGFYREIATA